MTGIPHLLALDIGTTSVKAALFDPVGLQLEVHIQEYELEKPSPNVVELEAEVYWQATQAAITGILRKSQLSPVQIRAVGVTSQGESLIVLDKAGLPVRKAIVWLDNRAEREAAAISAAFAIDEVYRITGQQEIVPTWTATKILWIRENEPTVFARAAKFLLVEDYIIYRLTGRYVTDHALNPSTLYYDLTTGDWWPKMLEFLGITRKQLPELQFSGQCVGTVCADIGLTSKTVVVTAPIDQVAGAVGAGNIAPGMVTETTGSAMAICASCSAPQYDPQKRVGLYRHATPESYILLPWVPTAGMIFRWFRDEFGSNKSYQELDQAAAKVSPGAEGLLLLPHLNGAFCPKVNPQARGVFYGFSLGHTQAHFVRSLFEAVAFMLRENLEMLESLGVPVEQVCSLGGGARSDLWLQIKADVLNREILTIDSDEETCLGVAVLAAIGAGLYADLPEAISRMVRIGKSFQPNPTDAAKYHSIYQKYLNLNKKLLPTFGE